MSESKEKVQKGPKRSRLEFKIKKIPSTVDKTAAIEHLRTKYDPLWACVIPSSTSNCYTITMNLRTYEDYLKTCNAFSKEEDTFFYTYDLKFYPDANAKLPHERSSPFKGIVAISEDGDWTITEPGKFSPQWDQEVELQQWVQRNNWHWVQKYQMKYVIFGIGGNQFRL